MKFDYNELYNLLYGMKRARTLTELSDILYCSVSKCSKMIRDYETRLKVQLYVKNEMWILSSDGERLLNQIERPLLELKEILQIEQWAIGIDENLIEDLDTVFLEYDKQYSDSQVLIDLYKSGKLNKIIVSSDFEEEFEFKTKKFIIAKNVYRIKHKQAAKSEVYANAYGCPIRKKLEVSKVKVDETLKQSTAICKMIRSGKGVGYTFSVDTLDADTIEIKAQDNLTVNFFWYTKY